MTGPRPFNIDPEVEEILHRIAADQGSALLRVPRTPNIRGLLDQRPHVTSGSGMLTSAERHLLQVHRSGVGRLLLEICKMKLIDGPGAKGHVSPFQTRLREHTRWTPPELARQANQVSKDARSAGVSEPLLSLVERCVQDPFGYAPTVTQLAEASLRLEPTDDARIMAALDLTRRGAPEAAIRLLHGVLLAPASRHVAVCTWNNLGVAYSWLREMHLAHEQNVAACNLEEDRLEVWTNRLVLGIQLGLVDDARLSAQSIDALAPESHAAVNLFAEAKEKQREEGNWSPSVHSYECIRKLESRLGPASRRIVAVFGPVLDIVPPAAEVIELPPFNTGTGILPKTLSMKACRLVS